MANRNLKKVVIVGRPNVGKSTLFNRLSGRRRALIHDLPGMTRDRLSGIVTLDDDRRYELTDTGGLEYGESPMSAYADEIRGQATRALRDADFILFVVDGAAGLLSEDRDIAQDLRRESSKTVLIVNKTDRRDAEEAIHDFWALGFDRIFPLSAEHGQGLDELLDAISEIVPPESAEEEEEDESAPVRVAIIGRPNVGKSSLLNKLTQEERAVVSPISGTTRDAIDSEITRNGRRYLIIDTAGIRRKGKTTDQAEKLAVMSARNAIERCEIALCMFDATEGVTGQDATVAGYADEGGKAALIVINKWDAEAHEQDDYKKFEDQLRFRLKFLAYAPLLFISAKTGRGVEKIFPKIDQIISGYRKKFRTSELNTILERAVSAHNPPVVRGKPRRFYYVTQLKSGPPTFALFSNVDEPLHFSYKRYLENQFRDALGLVGCPIHFVIRARKGMKK
ncbi:MAG TPA: ribosome biogenesis GTPase Der [Thermoanaerobaculia bacterium]|jgi:GTP-binding protein|nr:ribosome biogenesis GTPase Der [Thermoanaerobaculia bacterium]